MVALVRRMKEPTTSNSHAQATYTTAMRGTMLMIVKQVFYGGDNGDVAEVIITCDSDGCDAARTLVSILLPFLSVISNLAVNLPVTQSPLKSKG